MATLESLLVKVGVDAPTVYKDAAKAGQDAERGLAKADTTIRPGVDDSQAKSGIADVVSMVEGKAKSADATLMPDVDDSKAVSGIVGVVDTVETRTRQANATITPGVDDGETRTGMTAVVSMAETRAAQADATIKPMVDGAQTRGQMDGVVDTAETKARAADVTIRPEVDKSGTRAAMDNVVSAAETRARQANAQIPVTVDEGKARSQMAGAVSAAESKAKGANVTITPEIDDSKAESGMDGLMGSLKSGAKTGGLAAGAVALAAFWDAISSEASVDKTAASLGLSDKQMARVGEVAGRIFANNWASSVGEAATGVQAVIGSINGMRNAGVDALERVSSKALAFADILEIDVDRAAQVAGQTVRLGLAKNADRAFDLLMAASQRVPPAIREDLLDAVDEYGPFFKTIGLSGEEAFNLLVKGAERGMYGIDKTGDAIKEFTIRATDGSDLSQQAFEAIGLNAEKMTDMITQGGDKGRKAFDQIITGLLGIKDPSDRANTAIKLFGTPLEDLNVGEIPRFLKSLQSMDGELGKVSGTMERSMTQASDNMQSNLMSMANTARLGAQNIVAGILSGDWDRVGKGITQVWESVKALFQKYWRQILVISTGGLGLIILAVIDNWDKITGFFKNAWDKITGFFKSGWEKVGDVTSGAVDKVKNLVSNAWGKVRDVTDNVWGKVRDVIDNVWDKIRNKVGDAVDAIRTKVANVWDDIKTKVGNVVDAIRNKVGDVWDAIRKKIGDVIDAVRTKVGNVWDDIRTKIGNVVDAIRTKIANIWDAIRTKIGNVVDDIRTKIGNVWDAIREKIGNVVDGIRTKLGNVWDNIRETTTNVFSTIRERLGNIWDNIRDKIGNVADRIKDIFGNLMDAARKIPEVFNNIRERIANAWERIKDIVARPVQVVLNIFEKLTDAFDKVSGALGGPKINFNAPNIGGAAKGAVIPGYTPGRDTRIVGVSGGEAIMRPEWTRAIGAGEVHRMNKVARTQGVQGVHKMLNRQEGYAEGGLVQPNSRVTMNGEPLTAIHRAQIILAGRLSSAMRVIQGSWQAPSSYSGTSHTGPGVADTSPGSFAAQYALRRVGVAAWARNIRGAAQAGSGAHVHGISMFSAPGNSQLADYRRGGDGLGGKDYGKRPPLLPGLQEKLAAIGNFVPAALAQAVAGVGGSVLSSLPSWVLDVLKDPLAWLKDKISGGLDRLNDFKDSPFLTLVRKMPQSLLESAANKIKDLASSFNPVGGGFFGGGNVMTSVRTALQAYAPNWLDPKQWSALAQLVQHESGWNPTAQNPDTTAYGLFQFLDGTWGDTGIAKTSDPYRQTIAAIRYIRANYGTPVGAWNYWQKHHSYDQGGVIPPGPFSGINGTGGNEYILNREQMSAMGGGPQVTALLERIAVGVENGGVVMLDSRVIAGEVTRQQRQGQRGQRIAAGTASWSA